MANTFTLIASSTVGSGGATTIEFTSIPSTYTDLVVKWSLREETGTAGVFKITFNNSGSGYTAKQLYGSGSVAGSDNNYNGTWYGFEGAIGASNTTANTYSNGEIYIPNYAGSANKSMSVDSVIETNGTNAYMAISAGLWSNSAAITSIKFQIYNGTDFNQYSSAYLYGVKNA
jgi:hypothetical protein